MSTTPDRWATEGFSIADGEIWQGILGDRPRHARQWLESGFSPDEASLMLREGFTLSQAREVRASGLPNEYALSAFEEGFDSLREYMRWLLTGFGSSTRTGFVEAGVSPEAALCAEGRLSIHELREWRKTLENDGVRFGDVDLDWDELKSCERRRRLGLNH